MKKIGALISIAAYLTLSNYCLAYSLVTGECHNPYKAVEAKKSELPSHSGCKGHRDASPMKSHNDSGEDQSSDTCCVTFSKKCPALLTEGMQVDGPIFHSETMPVLAEAHFKSPALADLISPNHGPPRLSSLAFASPLTPRAPPSLKSL